ncbi:hypothetical protein ACFL10_01965 [Patescibacteria group bacterium]
MKEIDPHKYSGPIEDLEKHQRMNPKQNNSLRRTMMISIGVAVLLLIGGIVAYMSYSGGNPIESIEDDATVLLPFIPVWFAIFIPLIIGSKKKKNKLSQNRRILVIFLVMGMLAVIGLTGLIFFIAASR